MNKKVFNIIKKFTEKKYNPLHSYVYYKDSQPETYIATDGGEMLMWHENFVRSVKSNILSLKPNMAEFEGYLEPNKKVSLKEKMPFDFLFDRITDMVWQELPVTLKNIRNYSSIAKYLPKEETIADKTVASLTMLEKKGITFDSVFYLKNEYAGEYLLFVESYWLFIAGIGIED